VIIYEAKHEFDEDFPNKHNTCIIITQYSNDIYSRNNNNI